MMTTEPMPIEDLTAKLAAMPEVEFRGQIDDDTRGKGSPELAAALRSEALMERWYEALLAMQSSVEGQLAAKGADSRAKVADFRRRLNGSMGKDKDRLNELLLFEQAQSERWRAGAVRFKSGIEEKLLEARRLLRAHDNPLVTDRTAEERNRALARISVLEDAIRKHREAFPVEDDPSDADTELWSLVSR